MYLACKHLHFEVKQTYALVINQQAMKNYKTINLLNKETRVMKKQHLFYIPIIAILFFMPLLNQFMTTVNADCKDSDEQQYEIYPQPQNISYKEGSLEISDTV